MTIVTWSPWRWKYILFILKFILILSPTQAIFSSSSDSTEYVVEQDDDGRVTLNVGGVFPMEAGAGGWPGGQACLPAVQMAFEDINGRTDILPGYKLHMYHNNSMCQPGLATQQLYQLLYRPPVKLMLLAGCSPVTTTIAEAAPVWKLVVISYGASSPALSNRDRFPTLFRTHPSANMQNPTRIQLFKKFGWKRITILQSVEEVFTTTAKDLETECKKESIRAERMSFYGDPTDAVRTLVRQDARVIVGLFYVTEARRVLCQAYKQGLYGSKYVWFFIGWYADTWYIPTKDEHLSCSKEEMRKAAQYHFTTESIMWSQEMEPGLAGMNGTLFGQRLRGMLDTEPKNTGGYPEAPLAYDAVWALALAFNCTRNNLKPGVRLEHFTYNNKEMAELFFTCVKNTSFKGVSGNVMFSDDGDRIARTMIEQLQGDKYVKMGTYDNALQELKWHGLEKWHGKGPPPDSTIIRESFLTVSNALYYVVSLLAFIGIGLSLACFIFNTKYGYRGVIVQSQPQCNNVLLAGCALCSASLFLMGLPSEGIQLSDSSFSLLCHSRISILMIGFTFAYGSMFAKVWIVHRIGASENQQIASRQKDEYKPLLGNYKQKEEGSPWEGIRTLIATMVGRPAYVTGTLRKSSTPSYGSLLARRSDRLSQPVAPLKFYLVIVAFFAVDVAIILAWVLIDPLQREEQRFPLQDAPVGVEEDVKLLPILELCQSEHQQVWTGVILGYKCLLLVFGLFLSYESRNLKLRFVNDSRLVGLAIYNVAILALVTGPIVTMLIRNQANANFGFISVTVILCTYISLGLVFVPKVRFIMKVPPSRDEIYPNGNLQTLTKAEQKKYDQLLRENDTLQKQIDEKDERIALCKVRLEVLGREVSGSCRESDQLISVTNSRIPTDVRMDSSQASPNTVTTTALIELQPCNNESTGHYQYEEMDNSSSSDEILL